MEPLRDRSGEMLIIAEPLEIQGASMEPLRDRSGEPSHFTPWKRRPIRFNGAAA